MEFDDPRRPWSVRAMYWLAQRAPRVYVALADDADDETDGNDRWPT